MTALCAHSRTFLDTGAAPACLPYSTSVSPQLIYATSPAGEGQALSHAALLQVSFVRTATAGAGLVGAATPVLAGAVPPAASSSSSTFAFCFRMV